MMAKTINNVVIQLDDETLKLLLQKIGELEHRVSELESKVG
jgi:hypothetical protein